MSAVQSLQRQCTLPPQPVVAPAFNCDMADPILTAALNLRSFLDVRTFLFTVPEYQRPFQWEAKLHTDKLLEDLRYAFEHQQPLTLLGNIILQQTDVGQGINRPEADFWWQQRSRNCYLVDGQQRITTLVMLYAAIQEHLRLADNIAHAEIVQGLCSRLGANRGSPFLKTQQEDFEECFDFSVNGSLSENLDRLSHRRRERKNAEYMLEWLARAADASNGSILDVAAFLKYMDEAVHLTLTMTGDTQLAFQTFANINYSGRCTTIAAC